MTLFNACSVAFLSRRPEHGGKRRYFRREAWPATFRLYVVGGLTPIRCEFEGGDSTWVPTPEDVMAFDWEISA